MTELTYACRYCTWKGGVQEAEERSPMGDPLELACPSCGGEVVLAQEEEVEP